MCRLIRWLRSATPIIDEMKRRQQIASKVEELEVRVLVLLADLWYRTHGRRTEDYN